MRFFALVSVALVACGGADDGTSPFRRGEISVECEQYLACAAIAVEDTFATLEATLGEESTCWNSADEARLCTASCIDGLTAASKTVFGRDEVCWVGGKPNTTGLFGVAGENWSWSGASSNVDWCYDAYNGDMSDMDGRVTPGASSDTFEMEAVWGNYSGEEAMFDCVLDGYSFTCEDREAFHEMRVSGTFAEGFRTGEFAMDDIAESACIWEGHAR